jgi:hypothetical protein
LSRTISVEVGTEGLKLSVHEAVVRRSSVFFDNAMKPEWTASRSEPRVVDLTDEDPGIFKLYLHWLYFKTLSTVATEDPGKLNSENITLSRCYVMGEKLMDIGFKNATLNALIDAKINQPFYKARYPGQRSMNIIYDGTLEGSPARRLLVDIWSTEGAENWANSLSDEISPSFALDLSKALLTRSRGHVGVGVVSWAEKVKDYLET